MQIFNDIRAAQFAQPTVLTIGNFDGIHRGHQALLARLLQVAREMNAVGGLVTFDPHPLSVLRPEHAHLLLTTPHERLHLAAQLGLGVGVIQPFTRELAAVGPATFMGWLKQHLQVVALVVGPDFALGRNRSGNLDVLAALGEEIGYRLVVIDPVELGDRSVRSSAIRSLLSLGQVEEAATMLGRPYHATGVVVPGDRRGRTIGTPTANIHLPATKLWPADGVYATRTHIHLAGHNLAGHNSKGPDGNGPIVYSSVTNLGVRPTVDGTQHRFETHLLDFPSPHGPVALVDGDLYGRTLTVEFVARLRGEIRFEGLPHLKAQIQRDIAAAREILPRHEPSNLSFFVEAHAG